MARYIMVKLKENMFDEPLQDILDKIGKINEVQDIFLYNKAEEIAFAWEDATEEKVREVDKLIRNRDVDYLKRIRKEIKEGQASPL